MLVSVCNIEVQANWNVALLIRVLNLEIVKNGNMNAPTYGCK